MYLTIVTPCVRYGNLPAIRRSINIPEEHFRWICIFDSTSLPKHIPDKCEAYMFSDPNSKVGNAQRNYALNLIDEGHIYFLDDDTEIHSSLWKKIEALDDHDFIHFSQINKEGSLRLKGKEITCGKIGNNFIVKRDIIGDTRFIIDKHSAMFTFAEECYKKSTLPIFIPKVLSIYDSLR
jgi:hypothetical protein